MHNFERIPIENMRETRAEFSDNPKHDTVRLLSEILLEPQTRLRENLKRDFEGILSGIL